MTKFIARLEKLNRPLLVDGVTMSGSLDRTPGSTAMTGSADLVLHVLIAQPLHPVIPAASSAPGHDGGPDCSGRLTTRHGGRGTEPVTKKLTSTEVAVPSDAHQD